MLLRSIRSQLLALVVATVVPFTVLIGIGLWSQWQSDQAAVAQRAIGEARVLAAQVDDHIGDLDNLLAGLSEAVSTDPRDVDANDELLRRVKSKQPGVVGYISIFLLDGTNIGHSGSTSLGRTERTSTAHIFNRSWPGSVSRSATWSVAA